MLHNDQGPVEGDCGDCPVAAASRRVFLRDVGLAVLSALGLTAAAAPAAAFAESVLETKAVRRRGLRRTYPLPATDAISVDTDDDVILARWQNRVYAFSLRCPHRGARLEWRGNEGRVFCPKHEARFRPDGSHESGRRSRDLDRYDLSRQAGSVVVDLGALRRADQEPERWRAAVIELA